MLRDGFISVYAVVMGMVARDKPSSIAPAPWPNVPSTDPIAEVARLFAINLRNAIAGESIRSVATLTGVSHVTLLNVLAGRVWPDLVTMKRLEIGLNVSLWPEFNPDDRADPRNIQPAE